MRFAMAPGKTGKIVGQNVKLESIRARFRGNEWLIVSTDRRQRGTIPALFTSPSTPFGDVPACFVKGNIHNLDTTFRQMKTLRRIKERPGAGCMSKIWHK